MSARRKWGGWSGAAIAVAGLALSPAFGAQDDRRPATKRSAASAPRPGIGTFTPASADPRIAAALSRAGLASSGFRFTPSGAVRGGNQSVTVAVRARTANRSEAERTAAAAPAVSIAPIAYNLGVSVGWRRFALSGDIARVDLGPIPGGREKAEVGLSYNAPKWSARVQAGADRPVEGQPDILTIDESYSVDLGGSYSLTRNLDVTAGVRYRTDRDRLLPLEDDRRDSQAVYIGTAFRF